MRVRRSTHDDADACARIMSVVAGEGRWILTELPLDEAEWALRMQANTDPGWVLVDDDGRVVGHLGSHRSYPRAPDVLTFGMGVLPETRGSGGGAMLLEALVEHARADPGIHRLELEVFPDNGRAVALYARCGFVVEGLKREHWPRKDGTRRDSLIMAMIVG